MTRFTTNILICSTKTPQLCYMLHSSPPEVKSLFYPGLWHLSWRPWWWETTVNRLSFFLKLLLYKIIIDLEKNPCWGSFVLRDYRKEKEKKKQSTTAASWETLASTEMQFHKLLNKQRPSILLQQWLSASIPIWPTGVEQSSGKKGDKKVTHNLKKQSCMKAVGSYSPARQINPHQQRTVAWHCAQKKAIPQTYHIGI